MVDAIFDLVGQKLGEEKIIDLTMHGEQLKRTVQRARDRNIVRPHIFRLRRKLEADPKKPRLIRTVRGRGYLFIF